MGGDQAIQNDLSTITHFSSSDQPYLFVHRHREMQILRNRLNEASQGKGRLVMLTGEAGIGKTWIAQHFAEESRLAGVTVLQGCCFEGDWQPTYGPWVEALGAYVRTCAPERLAQQLGEGASILSHLVRGIHDILPDIPLLIPLSSDEDRFRLYDAVIQFILAITKESPVLLLLDDLHWADRDSLRLLRRVARSVPRGRLMVLGAYRETELVPEGRHPLDETIAVLRHEMDYEQITIRGLAAAEVEDYLTEVAGQPLPKALARAIHSSTNGNPFYVREVFRHLLEEGKIMHRSGRWSTDISIRELGIPDGIRQVLRMRMARLSEETNLLLNLATGFAGGFTFPVLQKLCELSDEALLDSLDEALRAKLIYVKEDSPTHYDFVHEIVRQTIYEEMNPERQARLHRRIALAMEQVYSGRQMEHAAELAFQYHASASLPGAINATKYAIAAAEQARTGLAFERAVGFLRMARDLSTEVEPVEKADILCRLAISEAEALLLDDAARTVKEALEALTSANATARERAEFLVVVSKLMKEGGASAVVWGQQVDEGLTLLGDTRDLLWARLKLLCEQVEPISAGLVNASRREKHDPQAVAIARAQGTEDDYAQTLEVFGYRSREETKHLLGVAQVWRSPTASVRVLEMVARDMLYCHGDFQEAARLYQELLAAGKRFGSILWQAEALAQLALVYAALGQLDLAQSMARQANEMTARIGTGHGLHFMEVAIDAYFTYIVGGDWSELAKKVPQFASSPVTSRSPAGLLAAALSAFVYCRAGNQKESLRYLAALTPVMERIPPTMYGQNTVVALAGSTVWELQAMDHASLYRRLSLDLIAGGLGPGVLGPHSLTVARMAFLLGDRDEAEVYFSLARDELIRKGMQHLRAIVDLNEGVALALAGTFDHGQVLSLLENAIATFSQLGMREWSARALSEKEKLSIPSHKTQQTKGLYPHRLTAREIGVLVLLAGGKTNKEIASELIVSLATAERHIANIYDKIGVRSRAEAVAYALRHGFGEPSVS